ncbi:MAG: hypothetical protein HC927_05090 [Deltaproteobacteria bacterium]|nr:hypothetical protein [Deltaproteobacteria bacterium]
MARIHGLFLALCTACAHSTPCDLHSRIDLALDDTATPTLADFDGDEELELFVGEPSEWSTWELSDPPHQLARSPALEPVDALLPFQFGDQRALLLRGSELLIVSWPDLELLARRPRHALGDEVLGQRLLVALERDAALVIDPVSEERFEIRHPGARLSGAATDESGTLALVFEFPGRSPTLALFTGDLAQPTLSYLPWPRRTALVDALDLDFDPANPTETEFLVRRGGRLLVLDWQGTHWYETPPLVAQVSKSGLSIIDEYRQDRSGLALLQVHDQVTLVFGCEHASCVDVLALPERAQPPQTVAFDHTGRINWIADGRLKRFRCQQAR